MTLEISSRNLYIPILGNVSKDIERLNRYSRIGEITYIVFFSRYPYLFEIIHLIFYFFIIFAYIYNFHFISRMKEKSIIINNVGGKLYILLIFLLLYSIS